MLVLRRNVAFMVQTRGPYAKMVETRGPCATKMYTHCPYVGVDTWLRLQRGGGEGGEGGG